MQPPFEQDSPMGCLRCRHCQTTRATDFSVAVTPGPNGLGVAAPDAIIPIYCAKTKRNRPAYIYAACPIADGRYHSACNAVSSEHTGSSPDGDRCKFLNTPERLFLRMHWPTASLDALRAATGRTSQGLNRLSRKYNFPTRSGVAIVAALRSVTSSWRENIGRPFFSDDQKSYMRECFSAGIWPQRGGEANPSIRANNAAARAEVERGIAERGHPFAWPQISAKWQEMQPGTVRWRQKWEATHRRKGVFVLPDGSPAPRKTMEAQ